MSRYKVFVSSWVGVREKREGEECIKEIRQRRKGEGEEWAERGMVGGNVII